MLQIVQDPPEERLQLFSHHLMVIQVWMVAATFWFHGLKAEDLNAFFASVYFSAPGLYAFQAGKH